MIEIRQSQGIIIVKYLPASPEFGSELKADFIPLAHCEFGPLNFILIFLRLTLIGSMLLLMFFLLHGEEELYACQLLVR